MNLETSIEEKICLYLDRYRNNDEVLLQYARESAKLIQELLKNDTDIDINIVEDVEFINNSSGHHNSHIDSHKEKTNYFFRELELLCDEDSKSVYFDYYLLINGDDCILGLDDKELFEVLMQSDLKINWYKVLFHYSFIKCVFDKLNDQLTSQFVFEYIKCFFGQNITLKDLK